jgi:hypothetical protein
MRSTRSLMFVSKAKTHPFPQTLEAYLSENLNILALLARSPTPLETEGRFEVAPALTTAAEEQWARSRRTF